MQRRNTADKIAARLRSDGHKVAVLHAALGDVKDRDVVIDSFREGKCKVLITTNVLSRGIDVVTTSMVVNYDIPRDANDAADPVSDKFFGFLDNSD